MTISTLSTALLASPFVGELLGLAVKLLPLIVEAGELIQEFRENDPTPTGTFTFEKKLQELLRKAGLVIVDWVYNRLEPVDAEETPETCGFEKDWYRRRTHSRNRAGVGTLFGIIGLWRIRYEPLEPGLPCIFPLEQRLGITADRATPALAERVGKWAAQHTQKTVLDLLKQEHAVSWSVQTLRKVTATLSEALIPFRQAAQVDLVLKWLQEAYDGGGAHRPVLCVGRDGIFIPLRVDYDYHEAATATVSVLDRSGKRLGTVYLGQMPEAHQATLSRQLTALLEEVLRQWQKPLPRLEFVTDAGHHPTDYFHECLRTMTHPRTGAKLEWEWVVDFYHACTYVGKLGDALFGAGTYKASAWFRKMRHWLKHKRSGLFRVLHSAAAHHHIWELSKKEEEDYEKAYAYLSKRLDVMDYAGCRRRGLAIGSGVTEAACKIVFTQRFKQSGMTWSLEGGQVIVDLRTIWLSGIWEETHAAYLASRPLPEMGTKRKTSPKTMRKAA